MMPNRETDKLELRRNMANKKDEHMKENQGVLSTGARREFYEIHIKGQLDESWSDWLEGLEMGILNKLYGLNLTLLSVNEIKNNNQRR
jgi:hypothetical protein